MITQGAKPMSQGETVGEVLDRAADLIVRDGWTQGGNGKSGMCRCMQVAIGDAADQMKVNGLFAKARDTVWKFLGITSGAMWNDAPGRTAEEVIAALRAAAERARRGE